jgi:hypothetical protein
MAQEKNALKQKKGTDPYNRIRWQKRNPTIPIMIFQTRYSRLKEKESIPEQSEFCQERLNQSAANKSFGKQTLFWRSEKIG